jgi:aryl-alcohol dehydrogenase-like predicted oxidoreductase
MIERVEVAESTVTISKIGFGCAPIFAGSEMRRSAHLIEAALSAGIRHFDTAPMYGGGQSEDVLGQVLSGVADITLATKVGIERPNSQKAQHPAMVAYRRFVRPLLSHMPSVKSQLIKLHAGMRDNGPAPVVPRRKLHSSYIRLELAESLKRLKRDHVDLYLVHEPDQFDLDDEAFETFIALKREGIIGAFGLAYGGSVSETPDFGTVVQSRYRNEQPSQADNKTTIFHGVLRHGWRNDRHSKTEHASKVNSYIANVFKANPNVRIIFSASSAHQIGQVTAALK